ncbi:hypothetical protein GSI_14052 [Ganoderma sinense ZZ0214-1]|uniref:Peptide hydrolase n=1 Tax=Ganoderma sinense ZZ0214-1 TaxID=1077348 RepID=A0A2G8RS11_9APHY|nr:hypothetical protein GSI_14052 [Ganoderma sinense ZZ0214-1]
MLIPRPPDTDNNTMVRKYLVDTMKKLNWHIEEDSFNDTTPYGFLGATDSAAPCAFMLDLAETLDPLLNERMARLEDGEEDDEDVAETTLQLVFFDGEEAFKDWTAKDSIYGARYVCRPLLFARIPTDADTWHTSGPRRTLLPIRNEGYFPHPPQSSVP